jgi:hypothetical protein
MREKGAGVMVGRFFVAGTARRRPDRGPAVHGAGGKIGNRGGKEFPEEVDLPRELAAQRGGAGPGGGNRREKAGRDVSGRWR